MYVSKPQFQSVISKKSKIKDGHLQAPKVKSGGSYRYPPKVKTKEELDLLEAKARLINAKVKQIQEENG